MLLKSAMRQIEPSWSHAKPCRYVFFFLALRSIIIFICCFDLSHFYIWSHKIFVTLSDSNGNSSADEDENEDDDREKKYCLEKTREYNLVLTTFSGPRLNERLNRRRGRHC